MRNCNTCKYVKPFDSVVCRECMSMTSIQNPDFANWTPINNDDEDFVQPGHVSALSEIFGNMTFDIYVDDSEVLKRMLAGESLADAISNSAHIKKPAKGMGNIDILDLNLRAARNRRVREDLVIEIDPARMDKIAARASDNVARVIKTANEIEKKTEIENVGELLTQSTDEVLAKDIPVEFIFDDKETETKLREGLSLKEAIKGHVTIKCGSRPGIHF